MSKNFALTTAFVFIFAVSAFGKIVKMPYAPVMVASYDGAKEFYIKKLGMELKQPELEFKVKGDTYRWIVVGPTGQPCSAPLGKSLEDSLKLSQTCLVLEVPSANNFGKPFIVLWSDDLQKDFDEFKAKGVKFTVDKPTDFGEGSGILQAPFLDPYGNMFNLTEIPAFMRAGN